MKSQALRGFFEDLGFKNVQTVITSGNVIFESNSRSVAALEAKIEQALPKKLGFSSTTIIRSQAELEELVNKDPYKGQIHNQHGYQLVTFFKTQPKTLPKLPLQPSGKPYRLLGQIDNAVFGTVDLTNGKTPDYMAWLEKQFGKDLTSRTWQTIERILKKMQ
jgi:uncharacterized protein (DUF1697 family)